MADELGDLCTWVWRSLGGAADEAAVLSATGPRAVLPAYFDVTGLATASVAAATLAAAGFLAAREVSRPRPVSVDTRAACAAFAAEGLFTPAGWSRPELWDPVAEWLASPPGAATVTAAPVSVTERRLAAGAAPAGAAPLPTGTAPPFSGVRVLDLTRVIAGPVCTRFLAAYGADVLRLDPPGFAEVPALLPEMTTGKRTAALDLTAAAGRVTFERLVAGADVLVTGLRAGALGRLGYGDRTLTALNPALIIASLNAYGWDGPWRDRRGFDSLVQMSCGIAAAGAAAAGRDEPVPLPVQALDHATGYLLAAAVGRALTRRLIRSATSRIRASLLGTANLLWSLHRPADLPPAPKPGDFTLVDAQTAWGPARRVPLPGAIAGVSAGWRVEAGPLGRHRPEWSPAPDLPSGPGGGIARSVRPRGGLPPRTVLRWLLWHRR